MLKEYMVIAAKSVLAHKIRALLTTLGVIIGVASVILLMSLGDSARNEAANQIRSIGSNLIFINVTDREGTLDRNWLKNIETNAQIAASSEMVSGNATYNVEGKDVIVSISGVNENYAFISNLSMSQGRFISEFDIESNVPVAVLGSKIGNLLFPNQEIIGNTILVQGVPFTVVGEVAERGTNFSGDNDMMVYIPMDYARSLYPSFVRNKTYYVAAESEETIDFTMNRIRLYLDTVLSSTDQYRMFSQTQILGVLDTLMGLLTTLLSGIASISLIVGGIGIMNIMLVTVRERTREIGIRKALGARRNQILIQFLIEAIIITTLGGILGLFVSYLGAMAITALTDFEVVIGWTAVMLSLAFSISIGVIFGIYPASTASKLEPVDALRYE